MPFKSEAQRRLFYASEADGKLPKGTAARWEAHTPKGKKLPERVGEGEAEAKRAFVEAFLEKCAAAGLTTPAEIAAAADAVAQRATKVAFLDGLATGAGNVAGTAAGMASYGPILGLGIPLGVGAGVGMLGANIRNRADADDTKTLRLAAIANAYRRRAAEARSHAEVRKVVESDPSRYVVLG